ISCHNGPLLGGNLFQKFSHIGGADEGLKNVTGKDSDRYFFRVSPLRNVAQTYPYFHDGSAATLEEAISIMGSAQLGRTFNEDEITKLVAFMNALTGDFPAVAHPQLPRTLNK
ncbi:cytochrome C biogenesis protein CcsA, partial [Arthrospira platensis SPKY1]|nr:cytochrome C biogenesis protein CcsA [Arthrospira platensis SPKY1]